MTNENDSNILAAYLPRIILDHVRQNVTVISNSKSLSLHCGLLFVDIEGFTALAEELDFFSTSENGVEQLTQILNHYFERIISIVDDHGGDIIKFAGDAILAIWSFDSSSTVDQAACDDQLGHQVARAAQCAMELKSKLQQSVSASPLNREPHDLALRIAVGAGPISINFIGGVRQRWEILVSGIPLKGFSGLSDMAQSYQVVLTQDAYQILKHWLVSDHDMTVQDLSDQFVELKKIAPVTQAINNPFPFFTLEQQKVLYSVLPRVIVDRLTDHNMEWLNEIRNVSVLFINLYDLQYNVDIDKAQTVMETLQDILYRYEGSINKLNVDDKGVSLIAVMGLPPLMNEDIAQRAVLSALDISQALNELNLHCSIGVATGKAYCGIVGSQIRSEYSVVGGCVNLASRLMEKAATANVTLDDENQKLSNILCDETTYQRSRNVIQYRVVTVLIRGAMLPQTVCVPFGFRGASPDEGIVTWPLVGREREQRRLRAGLSRLVDEHRGGVIIVEGEPGIGKSRLLEDFSIWVEQQQVPIYTAQAEAIKKTTPYYAGKKMFAKWLGIDDMVDPKQCRNHVLNLLSVKKELMELAPLLNSILPLEIPDNALTLEMKGEVRARNTQNLLMELMQFAVGAQPAVVVVDDVQWLDSTSWALTLRASNEIPLMLLVLFTRPYEQGFPDEYEKIFQSANTERIFLKPLLMADCLKLVKSYLGVTDLPEKIATVIAQRAEGNPFYSLEIVKSLIDQEIIVIEGDQCQLGPVKPDFVNLPKTIEEVIASRIDSLQIPAQITLKIASLIGRVFDIPLLKAVYPDATQQEYINDHLQYLESVGLICPENDDKSVYRFSHVITQEVASSLMPIMQKCRLHRAIAQQYEQSGYQNLDYALVAYHWTQAQIVEKALYYLGYAAKQAIRNNGNAEAIGFINQALKIDEETKSSLISSTQKASYYTMFGVAKNNLGEIRSAESDLKTALELLEVKSEHTIGYLTGQIAFQAIIQIYHRLFGATYKSVSGKQSERMSVIARIYSSLVPIYYLRDRKLKALFVSMAATNMAEVIEQNTALAVSNYTALGVLCTAISLPSQAKYYFYQALKRVKTNRQRPQRITVLLGRGVYFSSHSAWQKAKGRFNLGRTMAKRLGDERRYEELTIGLSYVLMYQGELARSFELFNQTQDSSSRRGDLQIKTWGLIGKMHCLALDTKDFEQFVHLCHLLEPTLKHDHSQILPWHQIDYYLFDAQIQMHHQCFDKAWRRLERANEQLANISQWPHHYYVLPSLRLYVHTVFMLYYWSKKHQPIFIKSIEQWIKKIKRILNRYCRSCPIGQPLSYFVHAMSGELDATAPSKATIKRLIDCYNRAEYCQLTYEQVLAALWLQELTPSQDNKHIRYREKSQQLLRDMGVESTNLIWSHYPKWASV